MKLNSELAKYYYTASEARKVLGVDESTFQYWGRDKRITRQYLPGRKQPLYLKTEINSIVSRIEATIISQKAEGLFYRKATFDDLEAEHDLGSLVFGRTALPIEVRRAFLEANPECDYHLYDQDALVAYVNVLPLERKTIDDFMSGKIRGWQVDPKDIKKFAPNQPLECLIMDMVSTPNVPPIKRTQSYSATLLFNLLRTLSDLGNRGIEINKVYAIGGTPYGQRILRTAGFKELGEVAAGRIKFELDINESDKKYLYEYKENLKQWKEASKQQLSSA